MAGQVKKDQAALAGMQWVFHSDHEGGFTNDAIRTAAAVEINRKMSESIGLLRSLNYKLDALGRDGIHDLIREHARAARAATKKRKARATAKARATRAKNKAKSEGSP